MKMKMKSAAVALVAAATIAGTAAPASAWLQLGSNTQYPTAGGKWTYGFWNIGVNSQYYHGSKCHGSTAQFWNGSQWSQNRADTLPGYSANARVGAYNMWYTDDRYYIRINAC